MPGALLSDVLTEARRRLADGGIADAAREARLLVGGLLGLEPAAMISAGTQVIDEAKQAIVAAAITRRIGREPVFRILGRRPFFGLMLSLSPETLEPRPDTEILVERLIPMAERIVAVTGSCRILDLGTGTAAICLSLIEAVPGTIGTGTDISEGALETARANAQLNALSDRFEALRSDWFTAVSGLYDIIVSNPPYIRSAVVDELADEVKRFDPRRALDGGGDGLDAYRAIADGAKAHLAPGGVVGLEIGFDQRQAVTELMQAKGFRLLEAASDLGGNDRVLIFAAM